jgi:hypothetical protein
MQLKLISLFHSSTGNTEDNGGDDTARPRKKAKMTKGRKHKAQKIQAPPKPPKPLTEDMTEKQRIRAWNARWTDPPSQVSSGFLKDFSQVSHPNMGQALGPMFNSRF